MCKQKINCCGSTRFWDRDIIFLMLKIFLKGCLKVLLRLLKVLLVSVLGFLKTLEMYLEETSVMWFLYKALQMLYQNLLALLLRIYVKNTFTKNTSSHFKSTSKNILNSNLYYVYILRRYQTWRRKITAKHNVIPLVLCFHCKVHHYRTCSTFCF